MQQVYTLQSNIKRNVLRLIEYSYWVLFALFVLGSWTIIGFTSNNVGLAGGVSAFFLLVFGLSWYPKQVFKSLVPDILQLIAVYRQKPEPVQPSPRPFYQEQPPLGDILADYPFTRSSTDHNLYPIV